MRNRIDDDPPRVFAVDTVGRTATLSHEEYYRLAGVSPAASAAFDIMFDDDVPAETAWRMALEMDRQGDAEARARHYVELRRHMRQTR